MGFEKTIYNHCMKLNENIIFSLEFTEDDEVTPIDLTGRTARLQVRPTAESDTLLVEATSGSGLTITPASGLIEIDVASTGITAAGKYVWAIELDNPVEEPVSGNIVVEQDIVRVP